jgi:hypothetical protein
VIALQLPESLVHAERRHHHRYPLALSEILHRAAALHLVVFLWHQCAPERPFPESVFALQAFCDRRQHHLVIGAGQCFGILACVSQMIDEIKEQTHS